MKTASIVIGGAITDLRRRDEGHLDALLARGVTSAQGYVVAEITAVHTHRCARGSRGGHGRGRGWYCTCDAEAMLARLLLGDEHAAIAQDRAPGMPDSKTPDTHNPEVGQGSAVLAVPTSDAHLGALEP